MRWRSNGKRAGEGVCFFLGWGLCRREIRFPGELGKMGRYQGALDGLNEGAASILR